MGSEQSAESGDDFLRNFQSKYSFHKEINDARFGDIQIYRENGGEGQVFLKSHWCQSEQDYHQFLKYCNQRINNPHKNILRLIGFTQSSENQLCGDFSKITGYYEYYPHTLERELDRRHNRQEFFNEQEVWFLLEAIIGVGAFFESQNQVHGDIRPFNIFLTNEGFVKLADPNLVRDDKNAYIKALQYGEQTYLSPQLMKGLHNREIQPQHNSFKSDVYSLGMTMLEVCCLYTARSCYDYGASQIVRPVVDDLIYRTSQKYSSFLVNVLSQLVTEDESLRPSFLDLQTLLAPYQDQIQNLQPFNGPQQYNTGFQSQVVHTQQPQLLVQSTYQPQPQQFGQSQVIYQPQQQVNYQPQNTTQYITSQPIQGQVQTTQPYISSPTRTIQTGQHLQGSQVLYQNSLQPVQTQLVYSQPQQQVYYNVGNLDSSQTLPQTQVLPQSNYVQRTLPQQVSYVTTQSSYQPQVNQRIIQNQNGLDALDQRVNNALRSTEDTIQKHTNTLQYQQYPTQLPQQQTVYVQPQYYQQ